MITREQAIKNQEQYNNMREDVYYIISWNTGEIVTEYTDIKEARRACRKMGGTPQSGPNAYVGIRCTIYDRIHPGVIYNPRFRN